MQHTGLNQEKFIHNLLARYSKIEAKDHKLVGELAKAKGILMDKIYCQGKILHLQEALGHSHQSLDTFLSEIEKKEGFVPRAEVSDLLSRAKFLALLSATQQILDGGTPADHGPNTHRLQWYILYQAAAEGFLNIKPVALFHELGREIFHDPRIDYRSVWDEVFDFDGEARVLLDIPSGATSQDASGIAFFSSPEYLFSYLVSDQFPNGALKKDVLLTRLRQQSMGAQGVLNLKEGLVHSIALKKAMKEDLNKTAMDLLILELHKKPVEELEQQYILLDASYGKSLHKILNS